MGVKTVASTAVPVAVWAVVRISAWAVLERAWVAVQVDVSGRSRLGSRI